MLWITELAAQQNHQGNLKHRGPALCPRAADSADWGSVQSVVLFRNLLGLFGSGAPEGRRLTYAAGSQTWVWDSGAARELTIDAKEQVPRQVYGLGLWPPRPAVPLSHALQVTPRRLMLGPRESSPERPRSWAPARVHAHLGRERPPSTGREVAGRRVTQGRDFLSASKSGSVRKGELVALACHAC